MKTSAAKTNAATLERKAANIAEKMEAEARQAKPTESRIPYAVYVRLETEADRKAAEATKAEAEARRKAQADPTDRAAVEALTKASEAAKEARKAAKEAKATAPRYSFGLCANVEISEAHKTAATIAAAVTVETHTAPAVKITVTPDFLHAGDIDDGRLEEAARQIAKRTAANAVKREGTPKQVEIDNAARARRWNESDLSDMVSEAKTALYYASSPDSVAMLEATAATLEATAAALTSISKADTSAADAITSKAAADLEATAPAFIYTITSDPATNRRRAACYRRQAEAAATLATNPTDPASRRAALAIATHAGYMAVNTYLTDQRAIRTNDAPAPLSLEDLDAEKIADPRKFDPEAITDEEADRRALLKAAFRQVFDSLPKRAAAVLKLQYKGYTAAQISRKLNIDESTAREHMRNIAQTAAAVLATMKPTAAEAAAANVAAITAGIEANKAAALLEARRKAAQAERAKVKAAATLGATARAAAEAKATEATEAADRAAKIAAAIDATVNALTPTAKRVYDAFRSGAGTRKTAEILHKGVATIDEHKKNITRKIAAAVMGAAPDIDPAIIAAADLSALLKLAK